MNRKSRGDCSKRFWRDRGGNITPMFALMLVPLIGVMGMAGEGSGWLLMQRWAQNAADQAALAAAANNCAPGGACAATGTTYLQEVAAVSQKYNFVNGAVDTTVTASIPTNPAPCDSSTCYGVAIERKMPFFLLRTLGFAGNTTTASGAPATNVYAYAIAMRTKSDDQFCITTLSNKTTAFEVNGGPELDLSQCTVFAPNGGASCTNQAGNKVKGAYVGSGGKSNDNCGVEQVNPLELLDPFNALTSNLPSDPDDVCSSYWTAPKNGKGTPPTANVLANGGNYTISAPICGDAVLTGDVTLSGHNVLLIENGRLDLAGHTLKTASGGSLTIIFSGEAGSSSFEHFPYSSANGGVLDYSAPSSGAWSGVAMYQDPRLANGKATNFTYSGSVPAFKITGMIYAPRADVTLSGAINHATSGLACLSFFVNSVLVNGTASIFATPTIACEQAGLDPDEVQTLQKVVMVQ